SPYFKAARQGTDYQFEQHFYNGRSHFQEEVETNYEAADGSPTSILKEDAKYVKEMYDGDGTYGVIEWPDMLTNFEQSTCSMKAAMCCWPKDRQANDNNGNCAKPYDVNCVDKDPADNTDLCYMNMKNGNKSNDFAKDDGFMVFPGDNNEGEGAIHCHGFAWSDDDYDPISRYKGNNLFYVSMYDHMYVRGYVKEIPGAPMCACLDQMPVVSRSDCTQVDLTEEFKMVFDGDKFEVAVTKSEISFNACQGINNRNNDLWAYAARLYQEGKITNEQFGKIGRVITDDGCDVAVQYELEKAGLTRGYSYDDSIWTKVAGKGVLYEEHPFGREAFNTASFVHSLTAPTPILKRGCADCEPTHRVIYYRRLTPISKYNFDLLDNLLYRRDNGGGDNVWGEDFTMHSTYEDAVSGSNPWKCPNNAYNYGAGFPGDCSPDGTKVGSQEVIWDWSRHPDAAWFVNKPTDEGLVEFDTRQRSGAWSDVDIGAVGIEGKTMVDESDRYHISGSGNDIAWQKDEFRFLSQQRSGDLQVDVHVAAFTNTEYWSKAGIMLRSNFDDDAEHAFVYLTGDGFVYYQGRKSKGASHFSNNQVNDYGVVTNGAVWLRLVKKMETIEFWKSSDGISWVLHASAEILFPEDTFQVGLAVTSHNNGRLSEATFENYEITDYNWPTSAPSISSAPTVWTPSIDIGEVQRDGEFYPEDPATGITILKGSGTGTWGSHDSFFFNNIQKGVDESFSMECYVKNWGWNYEFSKGGLMIRDGNDADAANAFISITGREQGVAFQSRGVSGALTRHHSYHWVESNNVWLKLSKSGSTFNAFYKSDAGDEWIPVGTTQLELTGNAVTVGLAVTAGDEGRWSMVQLDVKDFKIQDDSSALMQ
ncbi:hypothetical protein ACHAXS_004891, partial [Conticribra weissflogii]